MKINNIVGIDPSLTATAVCVYPPSQSTWPWTDVFSSKPAVGLRKRIARYNALTDQVLTIVLKARPCVIFIEGHSFSSKGKGILDRAEYRGVLSAALIKAKQTVHEVPPATLKLFIAGKGNANKTAMITACVKRYGVEYETDDEYDAYGLCRLGACVMGLEQPENEAQKRAIKKLEF